MLFQPLMQLSSSYLFISNYVSVSLSGGGVHTSVSSRKGVHVYASVSVSGGMYMQVCL